MLRRMPRWHIKEKACRQNSASLACEYSSHEGISLNHEG